MARNRFDPQPQNTLRPQQGETLAVDGESMPPQETDNPQERTNDAEGFIVKSWQRKEAWSSKVEL